MKEWQNPSETNLPVDLLLWVYRDGVINSSTLRTFLFLKLTCPDRLAFNDRLFKHVSVGLNINLKTSKTHIYKLIKVNFIGYDVITNTLYIRSKYNIIPKERRITNYVVSFHIDNLFNFTEYVIAAAVSYLVRRKKLIAKYKLALSNEGALRGKYMAISKYYRGYSIALSYISKFIGKSISWVEKYKKRAIKLNLINAKHRWTETGIFWRQRHQYLINNLISMGRAKKHRGKLHLIDADILTSCVHVRKIYKGKKV